MSTNQKSPIDINMIINTIKKVIESELNRLNPLTKPTPTKPLPQKVFSILFTER